jgi:hypothetical protein
MRECVMRYEVISPKSTCTVRLRLVGNHARDYQISMSRIAYLPVACCVSRMPVGVNRSDFQQRNISPLMMFRLKSVITLATEHPALHQLRHKVNTVRTAAWDGRTVAKCTDKWKPEPNYLHLRPFFLLYSLYKPGIELGLSVILRLHTHTHTQMTLWGTDKRRICRKPVARTHAITHSSMRDFCQLRLTNCSLSYCELLGYGSVAWLWRCNLVMRV